MIIGQKALRIAVADAAAKKSAISELILQQLGVHGAMSDASAGKPENADLLVTTGAEFSGTMAGQAALLVLDATEANKKSLLGETGFHTSGDAWAYFVAKAGPGSFRVIELAKNDSAGVHKAHITPIDKTQPLPPELMRSATRTAVTRDRPDLAVDDLVSAILDHRTDQGARDARKAGGPVIPPGVKTWMVSYTLVRMGEINMSGRTQNPSMSITYDVIAILNNPATGAQYQYIYIHQKGVVNPGTLVDYANYWKGFGQFAFVTTIAPTSHPSEIVYDGSSPANVNDKRTITSNVNFSVQYTGSSGGAQFDYSESISQDIFDWQIIEETVTSNTKWTFAQRFPFNALGMVCAGDAGDSAPFDYWNYVKPFPDLSRYTLQPQTQSVWRTLKVLNEPVTFSALTVQLLQYFWYRFMWYECNPVPLMGEQSITVDLSKVSG